jgi:hypothetical protein
MAEGKYYEDVGFECGTLPDGTEVVGLMFPLENSHIDDVWDMRYLSIPAVKALIIDLQEAITICMAHQSGEELPPDGDDTAESPIT